MPRIEKQYRGLLVKDFSVVFFPLVVLLVIILGYLYNSEYGYVVSSIEESERVYSETRLKFSEKAVMESIRDMEVLSDHIEDAINDGENPDYILGEMQLLLRDNPAYDQARIISKDGMELFRVDIENGVPLVTEESKLQDKSDRYYFRDLLKLGEGDIYLSPLDLNYENGEIELPLNPVMRLGKGIYSEGEVVEYFLFNLRGGEYYYPSIISGLDDSHDKYVLDSRGYWIMGPSEEVE